MKLLLTVFALSLTISLGCGADLASTIEPTKANKERLELVQKFNETHTKWRAESEQIKLSSRTTDYINLPAYRQLVSLGSPALPLFYERLNRADGLDFMLAHAVLEITGSDQSEFRGETGEQAFASKVAKKLKHEFDSGSSSNKASDSQMLLTLSELVDDFAKITNGMSRGNLSRILTVEGGLSTQKQRTYVHPRCPHLKVDVQFAARKDATSTGENSSDTIQLVSTPYLAWSVAD